MISIILPIYNVEDYLEQCLTSCLKQSYTDFEIIAVNDGSTDQSRSVLEKIAVKDARIRVFHQDNQGVMITRNRALRIAQGEYVLFLDADDRLPVHALEVLLEALTQNHADISVGNYIEVFEGSNKERHFPFSYPSVINGEEYASLILNREIQWGLCGKLYKKILFHEIEEVSFRLGEDASLLIQALLRAQKIIFVNKRVYEYLQREGSAVHAKPSATLKDILSFREWIINYIQKYSDYNDLISLSRFVADGYIECLLQGGGKYLDSADLRRVIPHYRIAKFKLFKWQRILFEINRVTPGLLPIILFKLKMIRKLKKYGT